MERAKRGFRVVEVFGECRLRDGAGVEHPYWRRDGSCLAPGWYVVHWPAGATVGRFNENALFEGPFRARGSAEAGLPKIVELVAGDDARVAAGRRSPEEPILVVDDRAPLRQRRST